MNDRSAVVYPGFTMFCKLLSILAEPETIAAHASVAQASRPTTVLTVAAWAGEAACPGQEDHVILRRKETVVWL